MAARIRCIAIRYLSRRAIAVCWLITTLGCWNTPALAADQPDSAFRPALEGYPYAFPRDHGAHDDFRTEWWYYTGHLAAPDGHRFGYELTFFRRGVPPSQVQTHPSRWSLDQIYLAHLAITDISGAQFHFEDRVSRSGIGKAGADTSQLHVWLDHWTAAAIASGQQTLTARTTGMALALTLDPLTPPVIHGEGGISKKGAEPGQASHYYSFPRLATTGTLTLGATTYPVTGTSWMDHEFGSADLGNELVGWDWFSIHLADNRALMLYRLRRADGSSDPVSSGTLIEANGQARHLSAHEIQLTPLDTWTSPASKATYPRRWQITIPSLGLSLTLTPLLDNQELRTTRSTQVTYWEGAVAVEGTENGQTIKGQGYVEMTGYAERFQKKL